MTTELHFEVLPEKQKLLFDILAKQAWISPFYLAGGTSLALQIQHRQSIDFDFFTQEDFDVSKIVEKLGDFGKFKIHHESQNTINAVLNDIGISFFKYRYPLISDAHKHGRISIADLPDIAAMKLEAVSGRGSRKDFIDLFFLLQYFSIPEIFEKYRMKYGEGLANEYHLLKSLVYFEDAEQDPMPKMIEKISWFDVKQLVISEVKEIH